MVRVIRPDELLETRSQGPLSGSGPLLRGVGLIVRSRTERRFAAVYPAAMQTIAINDGAHVSTTPDPALHQTLEALLESGRGWLLFDTQLDEGRVVEVADAQEILCRQTPAGIDQPRAQGG